MLELKADLHVHSSVSDGRNSPREVIIEALRKGIQVISVTDHDSFEGSLRAARFAGELGEELVVIVGSEIRTVKGDILVYCTGRPPARIPVDPLELRDRMHEEACLVVPAHPFDKRRKGIGELIYAGGWDAVEVFNAHSDPWSNRRALEAARELGVPGLANSDAHVAEAIGSAYNIIMASDVTVEDVFEALAKGNVTPVYGRPSVKAIASTVAWSIKRRLRKKEGRYGVEEDYPLYE